MKRGIVCICLSAFGFSLMAMFVRLADDFGSPLPAVQKAFFRNLVAVGIALWTLLHARRTGHVTFGSLRGRDWRDLVLRSTFGTLGVITNFYAISYIPIADAMVLNKTAPFFTLVGSWLLLGERIGLRSFLCTLGAFAGAVLVIKPGWCGVVSVPASIGLLSGLCAGLAYTLVHRLGRNRVNAAIIILFFSVFSCVACLPFLVFDFHAMTALQVLTLCGAGAGAALGQFGITWAYRFAEPRQIAVYDYSGVVFAALFGFAVFGQIPDLLSVCGFVLIVLMAFSMFRQS